MSLNSGVVYLVGPWVYGLVLGILMLLIAPQNGGLGVLVAAVYTIAVALIVGVFTQRGGRRASGL